MEFNLLKFCEIDKYATKSYCAIYNEPEDKNLGDITKIDLESLPECDFVTTGSPCQSFSVAGKQHGGDKGSGTRSSLMWNNIDVVEKTKPKFVLWENVKNLLSDKHRHNFDAYIEVMDNLGYNSYYKVLNAKDYGIPQNRERVYTLSIRKDIDKGYEFPEPVELKLKLKDMLEKNVDEKYYLSQEKVDKIQLSNFAQEKTRIQDKDYCDTLLARDYKDPKCVRIGGIFDKDGKRKQAGGIWDKEGLCPTLDTAQGGWRQPSVVLEEEVKVTGAAMRGRYNSEGKTEQQIEISDKEIANALTTVQKDSMAAETTRTITRVRKLTPLEYWKLMGFKKEDFDKVGKEISASQRYKQAGNSIVVNVLEAIYKNIKKTYPEHFKDGLNVISLFSGIGAFEKALKTFDN